MSMFLGPIHYWLYNKIGHQEELTRRLADLAVKEGWISDAAEYVRDLPALETVIDGRTFTAGFRPGFQTRSAAMLPSSLPQPDKMRQGLTHLQMRPLPSARKMHCPQGQALRTRTRHLKISS